MLSTFVSLPLLALAAANAGPAPGPGRFFVATNGRDDWSGRRPAVNAARTDGPFATLGRAVRAIRDLRGREHFRGRIEIVVRGGVYYLDAPLDLGPECSGTAAGPVVFSAWPGEEVTVSGGRRIAGWKRGRDNLWFADIATPAGATPEFRQFFVDGNREIRARTPNFDPTRPYTGGWAFVAPRQKPLPIKPGFGATLVRIHTPGDTFVWDIAVPQGGRYSVWTRYGALNKAFGRTDMADRTCLQVDDGPKVWLKDLPDTGAWNKFEWRRTAALELTPGKHRLRWTNVKGGGLNLDAFVLTDDPDWTPKGTRLPAVAPTRVRITVQAEAFIEGKAKEYGVSQSPGSRSKWHRDRFFFRTGDIRPWPRSPAPEIHIFPAWGWVNAILSVDHVDFSTNTVYVKGRNCTQDLRPGNRYYVENVFEALDSPGEWYLDQEKGRLYYRPRTPDFKGRRDAVAPALFSLIRIHGDDDIAAAARAGHIEFHGFTFRHTRYSLEMDSVYTPDDAAIQIENADHCRIEDCRFVGLGGYAVRLRGNSSHNRICANTIIDGGQGGVLLEGAESSVQPRSNEIAGNRIERCGRIWKHVAGVYVTTGSDNRIAHNTIREMPRYGISLKSFSGGRASHGNVVEYNRIERSNLETNDTGAIETLGRDRADSGNIIRFNLILDVVGLKTTETGEFLSPHYTWGIYLDDYSSGTMVYGNIVARTVRGALHIHIGRNNVVENNVFVDGTDQQIECNGNRFMRNNQFRRNIVFAARGRMIRINRWVPGVLSECDWNLYWQPDGELASRKDAFPTGDFAAWQAAGLDRNSRIADPRFADAAHDD
ncbi:MAG: hypothetical protein GXP31_12420, partial [Kiritimatiellaeota bacterium]|nr:hypothetical protein [Kiritimatiellota bacterium]